MTKNKTDTAGNGWQLIAIVCFVVVVIAQSLAIILGVHGFWRGALLGASIALVAIGGIFLGMSIRKPKPRTDAMWLPSNDE